MVGKQVRVDNWGIYFLQRLQVFFSKTDYCDLTLQFQGNVQLKVHRLVMNACTDYFNFLERRCPGDEGGTIIMPPDLQSEVIVPIVNFMYTGMLEFHMSIFEDLYKAAELMNITVLTKLLDAQRSSLQQPKPVYKKKPESISLPLSKKSSVKPVIPELPPIIQGRKLPVWKRTVSSHHSDKYLKDPLFSDNSPKPTRFEWPEDDLPPIAMIDSSFEDISYTSKPLLTQEEETRGSPSTFSEKRYLGTKFLNIKEEIPESVNVKDKNNGLQIQMEEVVYEDNNEVRPKRKHEVQLRSSPKKIKIYNSTNSKETTINVKSSTTDLDHTKIVSEILKKYPNLVKKNKNIKLKIMPVDTKSVESKKAKTQRMESTQQKGVKSKFLELSQNGPWTCTECRENGQPQEFVLYYLYRKHMTDVHNEVFDIRLCKYCGQKCSKHNLMMYHLYTKHGLKPPATYVFPKCNQCPYIAQSQHKLAIHKSKHNINEMQCHVCELAFTGEATLTSHLQITGHVTIPEKPVFDCQYCTKKLQSPINLLTHIKNSHLKEARRDGIVSLDELNEADEDNDEEEAVEMESDEEFLLSGSSKDKVKILSNIKVENKKPKTEESTSSQEHQEMIPLGTNQEALNNVAGNLGLGLVDIVVLDDNQQYILQQGNQSEQAEFILPDLAGNENPFSGQVITTQHNTTLPQGVLQTSGGNISSTDELVMVLTDRDYQEEHEGGTTDNSNIVVLYSHPVDGQQGQFITSQGNLLMNSQTGMLELRDSTAITTTASQIVVNNAVDTPIESIEMIQREIESHQHTKQERLYMESSKQIMQPSAAIEEPPQLEIVSNEVEIQTPEAEIQTPEAEVTEQETQVVGTTGEKQEQIIEQEHIVEEQEQIIEEGGDIVIEQEETITEQEHIVGEQENQPDGENVEMMPEAVQEQYKGNEEVKEEQDSIDSGQQEVEPMEIDGLLQSDLNPQLQENQEEFEQTKQQTITEQGTDIPPSEKISVKPESPTEVEESRDVVEEREATEASEVVPCEAVEAMEVDGVEHAAGNTQKGEIVEETVAGVEVINVEEAQSEVIEEVKEEDAKTEDAVKENLPDVTERQNDATANGNQDKSEEGSASNRSNIDQAILEDWEEDTDSQQSEKKSKQATDIQSEDSGDNEEFKQNEKRKKAADNVNKLMDDWEDEDEDDKKDA